jgi:hypothetical protein
MGFRRHSNLKTHTFTEDGQTKEDVDKYNEFVGQLVMITPAVAGNAYARTVTAGSSDLSGLTVDYDDHRLPIADELKAKNGNGAVNYTAFTKSSN